MLVRQNRTYKFRNKLRLIDFYIFWTKYEVCLKGFEDKELMYELIIWLWTHMFLMEHLITELTFQPCTRKIAGKSLIQNAWMDETTHCLIHSSIHFERKVVDVSQIGAFRDRFVRMQTNGIKSCLFMQILHIDS